MNTRITFLFPAICLMILTSVYTAQGQVDIRDSVSISTMMDTTSGIGARSPLKSTGVKGPPGEAVREISSVRPGKSIDASIGLPEGGGITVTVVDGNAGASLDLVIRSPFYKVLVRNANAHHGFTWDTTGFPAGTSFDIGMNWYYWWLSGSKRGCYEKNAQTVPRGGVSISRSQFLDRVVLIGRVFHDFVSILESRPRRENSRRFVWSMGSRGGSGRTCSCPRDRHAALPRLLFLRNSLRGLLRVWKTFVIMKRLGRKGGCQEPARTDGCSSARN